MFARRPLLALALTAAALAGPALAQTAAGDEAPVSTAARAPDSSQAVAATPTAASPASAARSMTTDEQIAAYLASSPALTLDGAGDGPSGVTTAGPAEEPKRQIHGSMGATVGSGGYRSGYVSTLIPVGETGTLGIAVQQTDFGNTVIRGRGYGRTGLYGESPWTTGGRQSSVALSLALGAGGGHDVVPSGCAIGGFRDDAGRYVEPPWVTQMRGDDRPCDAGLGR